jgi:hypothetical protein
MRAQKHRKPQQRIEMSKTNVGKSYKQISDPKTRESFPLKNCDNQSISLSIRDNTRLLHTAQSFEQYPK